MKHLIALGTRPEIIKYGPILKQFNKKNSVVVFTGQHYDYNMSMQFFDQLGIRKPDYFLKLTKSEPVIRMSEILTQLSKILSKVKPDSLIVEGDTNSALASTITAVKSNFPVCHIEAGIRSYDWRMPEEHNRICMDSVSDLLFPHSKNSEKILKGEKVHGKIHTTGNVSIDAVEQYLDLAEKKSEIKTDGDFALVTLHRSENVDDKSELSSILKALLQSKIPLLFPVHPRTQKRLKQFGFYSKLKNSKHITMIPPVGYLDILDLMKRCNFIISDSGK
jgi:UDP-N-acetylglucosamine 2-epimerase (non-hydrolysing)